MIAPRSRGAKPSLPQIQKLSIDEKKAIREYFEKFEGLDKDKSKFSAELTKASREFSESNLVEKECLSCIYNDLKIIGWINQELNLFDKKSKYVQHRIFTHGYYSDNGAPKRDQVKNTWGNWNSPSHPYRSLFSSEQEWLSFVDKIVNTWNTYYSYMNSGSRIACSVATFGAACSGGKGGIEKAIDDSKASLELKIGEKLMILMNQLG